MRVEIEDKEAWEVLRGQVESKGGAMVACPAGFTPQPFTTVDVEFAVRGRVVVSATGQIVHISPDGHIALTFTGEARDRVSAAKVREGGKAGPGKASGDEPPGQAAWKRFERLTKPEKIRLARYGNQVERQFILRDKDASLHQLVLNNPGLTARELASLIRGGKASGAFIRKVTERSEWMGNSTIVEALVNHPLTPTDIAVRLIGRVPIQLAKRIAKSGSGKAQVVAAARRRVLRK